MWWSVTTQPANSYWKCLLFQMIQIRISPFLLHPNLIENIWCEMHLTSSRFFSLMTGRHCDWLWTPLNRDGPGYMYCLNHQDIFLYLLYVCCVIRTFAGGDDHVCSSNFTLVGFFAVSASVPDQRMNVWDQRRWSRVEIVFSEVHTRVGFSL